MSTDTNAVSRTMKLGQSSTPMRRTASAVSHVPNGEPSGVFNTLSKAARHFLMLPTSEASRTQAAKLCAV
ncbi:MAG: hypothetical protein O3C63_04535 [Cyanobacteria bacterium]|nr:hypothetical protein [Cyanobacteriota bacterium]MDA1021193.1 hypothetical protein [Cyanobacteriota bacterium]